MDYSLVPMYNKGLFNSSNLELKELKKIKEIKTFEFFTSNALFVPTKRIVFNFMYFFIFFNFLQVSKLQDLRNLKGVNGSYLELSLRSRS
jgi:hypothetical protein